MKDGIIVVGTAGHAKVVIELLRAGGMTIDYCVGADDAYTTCLGVPVLRGDDHLLSLRREGYSRAFIAIGASGLRQRLANMVKQAGYSLVNAISPRSVISPTAHLGEGVAIMAGVVINAESIIEDLAIINTGTIIDHDCHIGRAAHIAPQSALAGNVKIGNSAFLGVGCKVVPRVKIGSGTIVGAGGVVIADIPDDVVAVGVPAKVIKRLKQHKEVLL